MKRPENNSMGDNTRQRVLCAIFSRKRVENALGVIMCVTGCHWVGTLCHTGLNCQVSSEETLSGIFL